MIKEEWRKIEGFEDYQISNLGNVKSLKFGKVFLMKTSCDGHGYLRVKLSYKGNVKTKKIHKLVAIAFLNHKPDGTQDLVIDHINDNKLDNRVENLQIVSNRYNCYKTQGNYTSNFKGVSWYKFTNKFVAQINIKGIKTHLGYFKTEEEASKVYQLKLKEITL